MLLAGDIGGTKTLLGLFAPGTPRPTPRIVTTFITAEHPSLEGMIEQFLGSVGAATIDSACFGVAGPVKDQRAQLTNIGWAVAAGDIAARFRIRSTSLLNDLQAMAYSVNVLEPREVVVLQPGRRDEHGNGALIAAGTGLGEAMLHAVDGHWVPSPSEGGHADYSPRTDAEVGLMRMLTAEFGRAEWEHVLSGPGLVNIYRFTHPDGPCDVCGPSIASAHAPSMISAAALERRCRQCIDALEVFVSAYGAEAGNLALHSLATGGVFVGGGIAPKILSALQTRTFLDAFQAKGPMRPLLEAIPVSVILNDQAALLGAAVFAQQAVR